MQAKDIMSVGVATVSPDTPVYDVARLLLQRHISGVPVVDADGRVVGIVSEGDLIFRAETGTERRRSWWQSLVTSPQDAAADYVKAHGLHAADVMTRDVVAVSEDTPLAEIATLFAERRIKRVPVLRDGKLVGIVARADLLRALIATQPQSATISADDKTIRQAILDALRREDWAAGVHVNLLVADGVVHLWGVVDSEAQRRAIRVAAETTPGVREVVDHLVAAPAAFYGGT